jgi:hypothetical protein
MKSHFSFITAVFLVVLLFFACAKKERKSDKEWYEEDKKTFMKDCTKPSKEFDLTVEQKKKYCECMMEKIMAKYPVYSDANKHADEIMRDFYDDCLKEAKTF